MRTYGVVPEEPVDQGLIESLKIVPQQSSVGGNEVLGQCPIEPFDVTVHFGTPRVGMEVGNAEPFACVIKQCCEFAPVVGLDLRDRERRHGDEFSQEVGG